MFVKYGELVAGDFFFEPSYTKALAIICIPTLAWSTVVFTTPRAVQTSPGRNDDEDGAGFWDNLSMERVKTFGKAGTLSYVIVELVFWAAALPVVGMDAHTYYDPLVSNLPALDLISEV